MIIVTQKADHSLLVGSMITPYDSAEWTDGVGVQYSFITVTKLCLLHLIINQHLFVPVKVRNYVSHVGWLFGSTFKEKLHVLEFLHYHLACTEVVCWGINLGLFPTFFLECCRLLEARFLCEHKWSLRTFERIFVLRLEKRSLWRYFRLLRLLFD